MSNASPLPSTSGQLYVGAVITAGGLAVAHSLSVLAAEPVTYHWFILAGLTLLSGSFTIRIPTIPARLSVSETFVFAAVLLFGASAATVIVVLDSLIISLWLKQGSRPASRLLFNMAAPSVAIWIAAHAYYGLADIQPLAQQPQPILTLVAPLMVLAILYFLLNSFLIAGAIAFEKHVSAIRVWRQNFLWLSLNYFSGASVAALLLPYLQADYDDFARVLSVLLPLLLISYLTFKTALGRVDDANRHLSELNRLYLSTIETLAMAIDAKDQITHGHIRRVQTYAVHLARAVGVTDAEQIRAIEAAALLHDMGKLAVPEYILNKPGPLTPAEFEKMKLHASVGADILSAIEFPYPVVPIVRHHHENWDGTGYPDRLIGADIPIGARVLSVVDCYDALTSDRPYRPKLSDAEAIRILMDRRGSMYDPLVIDTFLRIQPDIGSEARPQVIGQPSFTAITEAALPSSHTPATLRSLDEIASSSDEMLSLFELSKGLSGEMDLAGAGEVILRHLHRVLPYSSALLYVHELDSDELVAVLAFGQNAELMKGIRIPIGQRLTGWVGAHRQTIRNSDPVLDLGEVARAMTPRPRSALTVPLTESSSLVGVMSLYSTKTDGFSPDHQRLAEVLASQLAPIVRQSMPIAFTESTASHDEVTGLLNLEQLRRFAREKLEPQKRAFALVHIDLSRLMAVVATQGRKTLDLLRSRVARLTAKHTLLADGLFRYSNDEFIVLLLEGSREQAEALALDIKHSLTEHLAVADFGALADVTAASAPQDGGNVEEVIRSAQNRQKRRRNNDGSNETSESIH